MARVVITIECNNAAFEGAPGLEIKRILEDVIQDLEGTELEPDMWKFQDSNGNTVGKVVIS